MCYFVKYVIPFLPDYINTVLLGRFISCIAQRLSQLLVFGDSYNGFC